MLWFLNLMFEVVWLKILALEVSLETQRKKRQHKLKVEQDYFQEEGLVFAKLVEPIAQIVRKKKKMLFWMGLWMLHIIKSWGLCMSSTF